MPAARHGDAFFPDGAGVTGSLLERHGVTGSLLEYNGSGHELSDLVLSPDERRARCHAFSPPVPAAQAQPADSGACSFAACFYGMLPRYKNERGCRVFNASNKECAIEDPWLAERIAWPSFVEHVQRPNAARCRFDTFVHTWSTAALAAMRRILRPRALAVGHLAGVNVSDAKPWLGWPPSSSPGMFASIERVLALKRRAEVRQRAAYHFVLLLRHDVAWHSHLELAPLDTRRLYLANACHVRKEERAQLCRGLTHKPTPAVDFFFAGSSHTIDLVFANLTRDIEHFCFTASRQFAGNHKVLARGRKSTPRRERTHALVLASNRVGSEARATQHPPPPPHAASRRRPSGD